MKSNFFVNCMGASVLALGLAVLPSALPAAAQIGVETDPVVPTTTNTLDNDDDGFDWGWLGLLGLIGLAGLKGRDRDTTTSYSDRTTTAPASTNPRY